MSARCETLRRPGRKDCRSEERKEPVSSGVLEIPEDASSEAAGKATEDAEASGLRRATSQLLAATMQRMSRA